MRKMDPIKGMLANALHDSHKNNEFDRSDFFKLWFTKMGNVYYFLFKKNLKVTNIQFAELLTLLRIHYKSKNGQIKDLRFVSVNEFNSILDEIVDISIKKEKKDLMKRCRLISKLYSSLFSEVVVVDSFYGSCAVFLPPSIEIKLKEICAYSGYIHSCGPAIWIRNVNKSGSKEFVKDLWEYVNKKKNFKKPIFFSIYAHETFSDYDKGYEEMLRDGLNDVKIYDEKFYIGDQRLVEVLKQLKNSTKFHNKIIIPDPGNYKEIHKKMRDTNNVDRKYAIWLVTDNSVVGKDKGDEKYFICYEQHYKNENQFHIFDENKPGWNSHTTLPHTLAGAMINLTRLNWKNKKIHLLDPFVGSGTIILEALKFDNVHILGSDSEKISPQMIIDNLQFFSIQSSEIENWQAYLQHIIKELIEKKEFPEKEKKILDELMTITNDCKKPEKAIGWLKTRKLNFEKILFYIMLRSEYRHVAAFIKQEKSEEWNLAFLSEARKLLLQIDQLNNDFIIPHERSKQKSQMPRMDVFYGHYSTSTSMKPSVFHNEIKRIEGESCFRIKDARNIYDKKRRYDVIITDPPYGINTDEELADLADLYSTSLEQMVKSLKSEGQLVIALPDYSHTGHKPYYFTNRRVVSGQLLSICKKLGKEIFRPGEKLPMPPEIYQAPYYWESKAALRRTILHFHIRDCK